LEWVSGKRPWSCQGRDLRNPEVLDQLARERSRLAGDIKALSPEMPLVLEQVIRRCLSPNSRERFQSAAELTKSLQGALEVMTMQKLVPSGSVSRSLAQVPFLTLFIAVLIPQVFGSATNILYNASQIVSRLSPEQKSVFASLLLWYNLLAYGIACIQFWWLLSPTYRAWCERDQATKWPMGKMDRVRQSILRWPSWSMALSSGGWLPGMVLFPLWISWRAEPLPPSAYVHFAASFGISWLISLTYTFFAVQWTVVELLYPQLWRETWSLHVTAQKELRPVATRLKLFQLLAGLVPLVAALLVLFSTPDELKGTYRLFTSGLIVAGSLGFAMGTAVVNRVQLTLAVIRHPAAPPMSS
jgi:hypothetical protein